MSIHTLELGNVRLTRIGYTDVAIPPEAVGLTPSDLAPISWRSPLWTEGDRVRVGAAAWFADVDGIRIVFDPLQAADYVLRANRDAEATHQAAVARLFAEADFPRESVDRLVMTHIEGVGMVAWRNDDGGWSPFFPNARVLVSDVEMREFLAAPANPEGDLQHEAWHALIDQGLVDTYADGATIAAGLSADVQGAHCPGHALLHFGAADAYPEVTILGHLAISPLHLATGECPALQSDAAAAWSLLRRTAEDGRVLIGPLWPAPGFGRWVSGAFVPGR